MAIPLPASPGISAASTVTAEYGVVVDYTDDGAARSRDLYAAPYYRLNLVWQALTRAERDGLEAFLRTYRLSEIEVSLAGDLFVGVLAGDPEVAWESAARSRIAAVLRARRISNPIAEVFDRYGADGAWYDPAGSSVWADTAAIAPAVASGQVARIDNGNRGMMMAPMWVDAASARPTLSAPHLAFDGVDDALAFPDDPRLQFGESNITIAVAVVPNTVTGNHGIFSKRGTGGAGTNPGWGLRQQDGSLVLELDAPGNPYAPNQVVGSTAFGVGALTRCIVEVDRGAAIARAYINGTLDAAAAKSIAGLGDIAGDRAITLGADPTGIYFFDGRVGRCLVIGALLSDADRQVVDDWLAGSTA